MKTRRQTGPSDCRAARCARIEKAMAMIGVKPMGGGSRWFLYDPEADAFLAPCGLSERAVMAVVEAVERMARPRREGDPQRQ